MYAYTPTAFTLYWQDAAGILLLVLYLSAYVLTLVVTFCQRHPPLSISNGKRVTALVEDEGENGLSGPFVSVG